jgi:predicted transposase YdaD
VPKSWRLRLNKLGESKEKALVMELMTSWERKGRQEGREEGRQEGQLDLLLRQLKRRFGVLNSGAMKQINGFHTKELEQLAEALLDFTTVRDLEEWLARRRSLRNVR